MHYTCTMLILAIETSCDETAVALVEEKRGGFFVIDEYVSSQTKTHAPFGGVVPNLAARDHLKNLPLLLKKIIAKNKIKRNNIDLIAVTEGPGLIPALLIGTNAAKAIAYAWKKPLVGVHHIAGHIYANFIHLVKSPTSRQGAALPQFNRVKFPILALIVSGGHTELIFMKKHMDFKIVGQTLDDAAGEAFDKVAKILELGYPGGPIVSRLAELYQSSTFPSQQRSCRDSSKSNFSLPRPMINSNNLNFSFSGLKTAVLYTIRDNPKTLKSKKLTSELCAEFQQAAIDVLVSKTIRAAKKYKPKTILLGGGVSANKELRRQLGEIIKKQIPDTRYQIPDTKYSLDNAAMIAVAGYHKWKFSKNRKPFYNNWRTFEADANLKLN
ncbi:MAG: tRNA (adenosine(37)-N6)-threonylcarbamoyltransferase complex transferase subunit TsaD [Patescibacteria group bacterium]|nr:tRNA (adenosine(37)-N6)-threonylcarbamoyltransferase complex transferase subunit TsaD [Patescibacteria group bacterium]